MFHLAQLNVARVRAPVDDPLMADFTDNLDRINALADSSPGFVWRLQSDAGNATDILAFDDPSILLNMSVWTSLEALRDYVFRSGHTPFLRRRREWFEPIDGPTTILWWVPAGSEPTVEDALARRQQVLDHGPTPEAFTFRTMFPAPSESVTSVTSVPSAASAATAEAPS